MAIIKMEYRLSFALPINQDTANYLRQAITNLMSRDNFGRLIVLFASEGGSTDQSLAIFNFLQCLPVPIRFHAVGHVGSAGIPVFLGASSRSSATLARFFFHQYDWSFAPNQTFHRI